MKPYRLHIFPDEGGLFRWRLVHKNGRLVACSGEGYATRSNARRAAWRMPFNFAHIEFVFN